jgi:hypothetical protein
VIGYEIKETEHGILVFGAMPIDEFVALATVWEARGFKHLIPGVANAYGATFAVGKDAKTWLALAQAEVERKNPTEPELQWLKGTDTGISSRTIFSVLCKPEHRPAALAGHFNPDVPADGDEFGRCHRLVEKFGWLNRLPEVAKVHPAWTPFVAAWPNLTGLFIDGDSGELRQLLRRCRDGV